MMTDRRHDYSVAVHAVLYARQLTRTWTPATLSHTVHEDGELDRTRIWRAD